MEDTLATKYRPKTWEDVMEQNTVKTILENQINTNTIKHTYLFCGGAGTGKTTIARIFANKINNNQGAPIELDCASNNSVQQIRSILDDCKFSPIAGKYKVYILDECHMITTAGFNAMLKVLEEPPETSIFILCTTNPEKIPATVLSRLQRFNFQKISFDGIVDRLKYIVDQEKNIVVSDLALSHIALLANGGMRDAITLLDKCLSYRKNLKLDDVMKVLNTADTNSMQKILESVLKQDTKAIVEEIERLHNMGKDLKLYIKDLIRYVLDYCIENIDKDIVGERYFLEFLLDLENDLKYANDVKTLVLSKFICYYN